MSFGKSKAKLQGEDQVKVTFADVAGIEEAKEEVEELVEFLRNPGKFQKLGGHIPRGVPVKPCWHVPLPVRPRYRSFQFPVPIS